MGRRKVKKSLLKEVVDKDYGLHPATQRSVWALVFLGIAVILILAVFSEAGPVGNFLYSSLDRVFGWGYYLLPLIFFSLSMVFFTSDRKKIYHTTLVGFFVFLLASLGLIDIIFMDKGGWAGKLVGALEIPFGYIASITIAVILMIISLLVVFNFSLRFGGRKKRQLEELKEFDDDEVKEDEEENSSRETDKKLVRREQENGERLADDDLVVKDQLKREINIGKIPLVKNLKDYIAPPFSLLKSSIEKPTVGDLRANANIIRRTLESFGIAVEMGEINIGPKVTRYTLKPAEGIKLSRLTALGQDLSLALAAHPIRIEAPIPGKSLVGIEVPNKAGAIVRLGSLMAYPEFINSGSLAFILGRDVNGEPIFANVEKMPHLLIAGSTGSGKSILIHSLLTSLIYKNSPQTLRLILIDPKRVELSIYNNLPHLISPVITEAKKAVNVFRWSISEMEQRYESLLKAGCRDINGYNKKFLESPLPYLLIVIDELADLMINYGRGIEG